MIYIAFFKIESFISNVRVNPDKTLRIKVFVTRRAKSSIPNDDFGIITAIPRWRPKSPDQVK